MGASAVGNVQEQACLHIGFLDFSTEEAELVLLRQLLSSWMPGFSQDSAYASSAHQIIARGVA